MNRAATKSTDMDEAEFLDLCHHLKRHYATLVENLKQCKHSNGSTYILFGVTGAGKSTTVARLLDKESQPHEFVKKLWIDNENGERTSQFGEMKIDEPRDDEAEDEKTDNAKEYTVHVGHKKVSTTVVPKPYPISEHIIVDMPGFAEADFKKSIIIDLLQKCYLTGSKRFRILIVVEIGLIFESKMRQLREGYHRALWKLLGEKYAQAMPHLYFILTKPSQADPYSESYEKVLSDGVFDTVEAGSSEDGALFARMLTRLQRHHMIVNLNEDDSEGLLTKINSMLNRGKRENKAINEEPILDIEHLEAGENRLNALCVLQMSRKLEEQSAVVNRVLPLCEEWAKLSQSMSMATTKLRSAKRKALEKLKSARELMEKTQQDIDIYPRRREDALLAAEKATTSLEVAREKNKIFKENFRDLPLINVRCDVAIKQKKGMGGKPKFSLNVNADIQADGSSEDFILIMEYEENDTTLRAHIKNNGSIVPARLSDVTNISSSGVLYNSKQDIQRIEVKRPGNKNSTGCRKIKVALDRPFKLFIYTERGFAETHYLTNFQSAFDKEVQDAQNTIERYGEEIKELDTKFDGDKAAIKEMKTAVISRQEAVAAFQKTGSDLKTSHKMKIDEAREKLEKLSTDLKKCENDEVVKNIRAVLKIFRANHIATHAQGAMERFTTGFGDSWNKTQEMKQLIASFDAADAEEIDEIQKMGNSTTQEPVDA